MFPDLKSNCSPGSTIKQSPTHRVNCAMCWRISKVKNMSAVRVMMITVMWWGFKAGDPSSTGRGWSELPYPTSKQVWALLECSKSQRNRVVCKNTALRSGSALDRVGELQFDWMERRLTARTCQDTQWFPYPLLPFILNFHVDPKAWHFDHYANSNSCVGACSNPFPTWAACLGHSKLQVQDCPPNLTLLMQGHATSCNVTPCSVVASILHIPGLASTSWDLWNQCFSVRKKHTGQDNSASAAALPSALIKFQCCKLQLS